MACVKNNCSSCSNCNNTFARVSCSNCNNSRCGCWNNWGCNHCGCNTCNHCGCNCNTCNHCNTRSTCGCNSCSGGCCSCCDHWNKGRSGCGCSSCNSCGTRSRIGVLRCISGPFSNCGNWWTNNANFPFYTGPCGPCATTCCCDPCCDDCCNDCCNDCCDDCCDDCDSCGQSTASFFAATPVELAAGDSVALTCGSDLNDEFTATAEGIRIQRAGTYMVIYTVHVPVNEVVNSRFALALNGDRVAASALDVATANDCTTNSYTMHALVQADCGDLLKLVTLNDVSIATSSASNVFTLTITRVNN